MFTFGERTFTFGEITFTFGDNRGFRGFLNFFFCWGFWDSVGPEARRGFRKYLNQSFSMYRDRSPMSIRMLLPKRALFLVRSFFGTRHVRQNCSPTCTMLLVQRHDKAVFGTPPKHPLVGQRAIVNSPITLNQKEREMDRQVDRIDRTDRRSSRRRHEEEQ